MTSVMSSDKRIAAALAAGASVTALSVAGLGFANATPTTPAPWTTATSKAAKEAKAADATALPRDRAMPVHDFRISAGWGHSSGPHAGREHAGIDFAAPTGEPVYSVAAGKVVFAGNAGGYGNMVKIRDNRGFKTLYGHLNKFGVKKGQKVRAGQRIGAVGSTGHSTGPHLHLEIRTPKDRATNPNTFLRVSNGELTKIESKIRKLQKSRKK